MTAPGLLRERLRFEVRDNTPDGYGNVSQAWVEHLTRHARVRPLRGDERIEGGALTGTQTFEITVRRDSGTTGITAAMRAIDTRSGAIYNITSPPTADERHRYLSMLAQTGVAV